MARKKKQKPAEEVKPTEAETKPAEEAEPETPA